MNLLNNQEAPGVVFVYADDWVAMYKDGDKVIEGTTLPRGLMLKALGIASTSAEVDEQWFAERGCEFPDKLHEVKTTES